MYNNLRKTGYFFALATLLVISGAWLCGCSAGNKSAWADFYAMDTIMQITCYGEDCEEAVSAAQAEIIRLDALLSTEAEDSEVSRINLAGGGNLSDDTEALVKKALLLYEMTDGAYDMTILPLIRLWGFTTGEYRVPDSEQLEKTRLLCDSGQVEYADSYLTLKAGQGIDFGGLAKGYASDKLVEIFDSYKIKAAYFSLGGNVYCYHKKTDGSTWNIAIENPFARNIDFSNDAVENSENNSENNTNIDNSENTINVENTINTGVTGSNAGKSKIKTGNIPDYLGAVRVYDKAVVTSGGYERYFTENDKTYHHIIDTATGFPADSGLVSVTVISSDAVLADGLSTACFVMGLERSTALWKKYGAGQEYCGETRVAAFDLVMMSEEGTVYVTEGIADSFTSDYETVVLR